MMFNLRNRFVLEVICCLMYQRSVIKSDLYSYSDILSNKSLPAQIILILTYTTIENINDSFRFFKDSDIINNGDLLLNISTDFTTGYIDSMC